MKKIVIFKGNLYSLSANVSLKEDKAVIKKQLTIKEKDSEFYRGPGIVGVFINLRKGQVIERKDDATTNFADDIKKLNVEELERKLKSITTEEEKEAFDREIRRRTTNYYYDPYELKVDRLVTKEEFKDLKEYYKKASHQK